MNDSNLEEIKIPQAYIELFPVARTIKRKHSSFLGPTNSGKTYQALQILSKSKSGIYLAPLRLMAVEVYDKLTAQGIPCNLITGEEIILTPDAKHSSSTIEMMNYSNPVDVAIIDEVQMINDPMRGWAWVQAIVGIPADRIIHVGSEHVSSQLKTLISLLGETYREKILERKSPLSIEGKSIKLKDIQKGDAIVAFSRTSVLGYRDWLMKNGLSCACIYGNLSPEVKRKQSELFSSGEVDVLVATDAIGMGLNLPIKRVIFSETSKYDGVAVRPLNAVEIKQIGGRAGRYGIEEEGLVGSLNDDTAFLGKHLFAKIAAVTGKFSAQPPWTIVNMVAQELSTDKISDVYRYIKKYWLKKDKNFIFNAEVDDSWLVTLSSSGLSLQDQYYYVNCPVDDKTTYIFDWISRHQVGRDVLIDSRVSYVINKKYDLSDLDFLEFEIKKMSAYRWLSIKFPDYYVEYEEVKKKYAEMNDIIIGILGQVGSARLCKSCGCKLKSSDNGTKCLDCK